MSFLFHNGGGKNIGDATPPSRFVECEIGMKTRRGRRVPKGSNGFALLLSITLLAFLVVLLLGLAAYTRIETAVATNTMRQAQARQNALMALNVALGQLQLYAGPDQAVTATADAFPNGTSTKHFTGVWSSNTTVTTPSATPVTWLVSGNELQAGGVAAPLSVTPQSAFTATNSVELVGVHTSGTVRDVLAQLQPITTVGSPGIAGATAVTIGHYAWWVGDQGVKAPVALADPTATDPTSTASVYNYAPYSNFPSLLSLTRQQVSLGAGAADATGAVVFEPRDTTSTTTSPSNTAMTANITAISQLAFYKTASATVGLSGATGLQQNFFTWSPNNFNVLANSNLGGLRQDLSLFSQGTTPSPLGVAYDAWANYDPNNVAIPGYMEDPNNPSAISPPVPAYSSDPLRRRYAITLPQADVGNTSSFSVAPILSFLGIGFSVRSGTSTSTAPAMEMSARVVAGLWNPYSSALVPPDSSGLQIRIHGLPSVVLQETDTTTDSSGVSATATTQTPVALNDSSIYGDPFTITLPWNPSSQPDQTSWLPGRVYNWSASSGTGSAATGAFYSRTEVLTTGIVNPTGVNYSTTPGTTVQISTSMPNPAVLTVDLVRGSDGAVLATYTLPPYQAFATKPKDPTLASSNVGDDFVFVYRLAEQEDTDGNGYNWLTAPQRDPRSPQLGAKSVSFVFGSQGDGTTGSSGVSSLGAAGYTSIPVSDPNRLLDRDPTIPTGMSYDADVPVFELPRAPILSMGELQHFQLLGQRPFAIGNSWGEAAALGNVTATGALFDQFFFSGLAVNVAPAAATGSLVLPNPLLKPLPRNTATGLPVTLADLQAAGTSGPTGAPTQQSSKYLLQSGAFNLNSVNSTAWAAVLRGIRFPESPGFTYLNADPTTGTNADTATATVAPAPDPVFLRFAQSAQETYLADTNSGGPPRQLFRQGMTTPALTPTQVMTLATAITATIKTYQVANGPFLSLEQFLGPNPVGSTNPSLLEQAIATAGINANVAEFSSQWLTQADIMTALAPVLFTRSDTFIIRTYGETVNPTTGAVEGKAWCEATAQRIPDYISPSADDATVAPTGLTDPTNGNQTLGRRFKIISFRWLTRSDI